MVPASSEPEKLGQRGHSRQAAFLIGLLGLWPSGIHKFTSAWRPKLAIHVKYVLEVTNFPKLIKITLQIL